MFSELSESSFNVCFSTGKMDPPLGALQNPELSSVLSSCEPELQELMRQIDIMISRQRSEWEAEMQALQLRLKAEGEELQTSRSLAQRQDQEIRSLRRQLEGQPGRQELVTKYEQQLQKIKEELDKLKRSYHKLQRKQLKEGSSGATVRETDDPEVALLHKKIEECQRLSADWEQQRFQLQNQLTELEAQNKRLSDELTLSRAQWESLKREREHRGCCLEVQRLRAQLETAQGRIHSQELELERLRAPEPRLGRHREQQVSTQERPDPHTSQDSFMRRASLERQRLLSDVARLNQLLHAKDQVIRCLEDCLTAQGCSGVELLRQDLEETSTKLHCAQACEVQLKAELACVRERLESLSQQRADQPTVEELRSLRAQYDSSVAETKKLREELQRARQTHSGELDGMRKEVSKLTAELHQRDVTIASLDGSSSAVRQQLRSEAARAELKEAELNAQLETLQTENQNLKSELQRLESRSSLTGSSSVALLRESFVSSLSSLEQENQQLKRALAQVFPRHGDSTLTCPGKYERALLSHAVTELPRPAQESFSCSDAGSGHHREEEQVATRFEGEIQRLFQQLHTMSPPPAEQPGGLIQDSRPQSSAPASSSSSSSSNTPSRSKPSRRNTLPTPAEGQSSSSDETLTAKSGPKNSASPAPEEPLSFSPAERMVSRFLEEENVRSTELLQRLDRHIQGMVEDNVMTVSRFLPGSSGPQHNRTLHPDPGQGSFGEQIQTSDKG